MESGTFECNCHEGFTYLENIIIEGAAVKVCIDIINCLVVESPVVSMPIVHTFVHVTMVMKLLTASSRALVVPILTIFQLKPITILISLTAITVIPNSNAQIPMAHFCM